MSLITIDYLKNHPEHTTICAQWSFNQWGHRTPERTLDDYVKSREEYLNDTTLPLTLLAFDGKKPVGMCSLAANNDIDRALHPWLPTIYVIPEYRNQGIGSLLEEKICEKAKELGYKKIYCYTSDKYNIAWYEKYGWKVRSVEWFRDHEVTVMEKQLL